MASPLRCIHQRANIQTDVDNILSRTMERLQMDYQQVLITYPVEIWVPTQRTENFPAGWPRYQNVGPIISLRLPKDPVDQVPAKFRYSSFYLDTEVDMDGIRVEMKETTAVQHCLNVIPEAQSYVALD